MDKALFAEFQVLTTHTRFLANPRNNLEFPIRAESQVIINKG